MDATPHHLPPESDAADFAATHVPAAAKQPRLPWRERDWLALVALALLALKALSLALDPQLRLFMGDSATYLSSAIEGWTPSDRSFTYPLVIRATAAAFGSIHVLLALQALAGAATAWLVCWMLRRAFGVRRWLAAGAAFALACEPAQLFYERMVMTESLSTLAMTAAFATALAYLRTGAVRALLACIGVGVAVASLRVGLVPFSLALGVAVALLRTPLEAREMRRWLAHVALALAATYGAHDMYKHWYAARTGGEPAYLRDAGIFRLGLVAPLVKPAHFADSGVGAEVLAEVRVPLADARFREQQIWSPDGLVDVLRRHAGERVRAVAALLAARAIADDPLGVVRLGAETVLKYFDRDLAAQRMWSDLGAGQPPDAPTLALLRAHFGYDASDQARASSPVWSYFAASGPWLIACLFLLLPLGMAQVMLAPQRRRRAAILLALLSAGLVLGHTICSHIVSFRYLHPMPVVLLLCAAALAEILLLRRAHGRRQRR